MARKMIVTRDDGTSPTLLTEMAAADELQLQEQMKNHPDLLPVDEFGMTGPLLVVGRETPLPSGAVDLLALTRSGDLLVIEFKTGPQNSDFRRVLAQLLDYGSDLWQLSYEDFQERVARRYFESSACSHPALKGKRTLDEAARAVWADWTEEDMALFQERVAEQLRTGAFHYLVVAQRFLPTMERTVAYMNATMAAARFYAVELVRFVSGSVSAFEARTVLKPGTTAAGVTTVASIDEERFLQSLARSEYRETLRELFEQFKRLGLRFEWGAKGTSIRVPTQAKNEPISVGWLFPPGVVGWMGLTDLTLGFDPGAVQKAPSLAEAFEEYLAQVAELPGAGPVKPAWLKGRRLEPHAAIAARDGIVDLLTILVQHVNNSG